MSVYGGIEFTEGGATLLDSYPGSGIAGPVVAPVRTVTIGGIQIGLYNVAPVNLAGLAGAQRGTDHEMLRDGRVVLTNDTNTAEWKIEGHNVAGLTADVMMANMTQDIARLIGLRQQVKGLVTGLRANHPGDHIIVAPGGAVDLRAPGAEGLFEYWPANAVTGRAQLTVQYTRLSTITRICLLNASKYLPGTKVIEGDDADMVADTLGLIQLGRYNIGQSSFASAQALLPDLTAIAAPVLDAVGAVAITRQQVGLIMLMVLNDAMASTMRRHAADIGQTLDKNIQRFFPKSRRAFYVNAVTQAAVAPAELATLRLQLQGSAAAMAQLEWDRCDPYALDISGAQGAQPDVLIGAGWADIQRRGQTGQAVQGFERSRVKNAVLGINGALLAAWIGRAALAYTDSTALATDHYNVAGDGNVILSINFTPVAGGVHGAVYEFREREAVMAMGQTDAITTALRKLFTASI